MKNYGKLTEREVEAGSRLMQREDNATTRRCYGSKLSPKRDCLFELGPWGGKSPTGRFSSVMA